MTLVTISDDQSNVRPSCSSRSSHPSHPSRPSRPPIAMRDQSFKAAAGCCIYSKKNGKTHILLGKEKNDEWCFAMGKRENGESLLDTAIRETNEEMHVKVTYNKITKSQWCLYTHKNASNIILIYFVEMNDFIDSDRFNSYIKNEDSLSLREYKWVPVEMIIDESIYDNLKIRRIAKMIFSVARKRGILRRIL